MDEKGQDGFFAGKRLLDHAKAQDHYLYVRGRINEMFPYVYEASKRMGIRAMSKWLKEEGQPISPATISRALASPRPYWEEFSKVVEPHAALIVKRFAFSNAEFLFEEQNGMNHDHAAAFDRLMDKCKDDLYRRDLSAADYAVEVIPVQDAMKFLRANWFPLAKETREQCREFLEGLK